MDCSIYLVGRIKKYFGVDGVTNSTNTATNKKTRVIYPSLILRSPY